MSTLEVYGHSYAAGYQVTTAQRATKLLATALGCTETNNAIIGTELTNSVYNGHYGPGWPQRLLYRDPGVSVPSYVVEWQGINDLAKYGSATAALTAYKESLRFCLRRHRASNVYPDTDASVAYGGTWTADSNAGGWTRHYGATNGNTITITTPSNFAGGTIDLIFDALSGCGAVWTATIDGAGSTALDCRPGTVSCNAEIPLVKGLAVTAGAHTIVLTASSTTFRTSFYGWQVRSATPPVVCIPLLNYYPNTTYYANVGDGSGRADPTHSDIDNLNAAITAVVAEFDSSVLAVDTQTVLQTDASRFDADGLHPNALGHLAIAEQVAAALTSTPITDTIKYAVRPRLIDKTLVRTTPVLIPDGPTGIFTVWNCGPDTMSYGSSASSQPNTLAAHKFLTASSGGLWFTAPTASVLYCEYHT